MTHSFPTRRSSDLAVHYDVNSDGSINYNSVTVGDPNGSDAPVSLHNVAAGTAPTDAVNVEQLMDVRDSVLHRQQKYRDEANAGIAAAIAMEAAPYLPDHLTYAIGSGYYGNQGAIGVTLRATGENKRKSGGRGKRGSVRVELGGRRHIEKK